MKELPVVRLREARALDEISSDGSICLVDLDAQRGRPMINRSLIGTIALQRATSVHVVGGVGDRRSADALLHFGGVTIILSGKAMHDVGLVEFLAITYPGRVAVELASIDSAAISRFTDIGIDEYVDLADGLARVMTADEATSQG